MSSRACVNPPTVSKYTDRKSISYYFVCISILPIVAIPSFKFSVQTNS